ncbi:MAG: hypothetical protein AAGH40_11080 [Verrucomicrobiota bacterium]
MERVRPSSAKVRIIQYGCLRISPSVQTHDGKGGKKGGILSARFRAGRHQGVNSGHFQSNRPLGACWEHSPLSACGNSD